MRLMQNHYYSKSKISKMKRKNSKTKRKIVKMKRFFLKSAMDIMKGERVMGYLRKDMVIDALREDVQVTKEMCYEGCTEKEIVKLCYTHIEHEIDRLPQYYPENVVEETRWIPCSERLPEDNTDVIICFYNGEVMGMGYLGNGIFQGVYEHTTKAIVAWMPLPEPYKEQENG